MATKIKLVLHKSIETFRPEIKYCAYLLESLYDVEFVTRNEDKTLSYGINASQDSLYIPANIFSKILMIKEGGIYPNPQSFSKLILQELKIMNSKQQSSFLLKYDAFAIIFFLVSRVEERNSIKGDRYNRFCSSEDFLAKNNLLAKVPVDQALDSIARIIFFPTKIKTKTKYNVIPTHDVDKLKSFHRPILPIRYFIGDIIKRKKPFSAIKRLLDYIPGEPRQSFNNLMSLSEQYGLKSRFFFMSITDDSHDSPYMTNYPKQVRKMLKNIKHRGHIVGFHPGYLTYNDKNKWTSQKKHIENFINEKVYEGRQHMLQYNVNVTPHIWNQNNMKIDYTLSYPDKVGFRNGTCRPIFQYDLNKRHRMNLISISTSIMDFGLFGGKYNDYNCDAALELCKPIIDVCRRYNGSLVILMHTGKNNFKNINFFYSELLKLACKTN